MSGCRFSYDSLLFGPSRPPLAQGPAFGEGGYARLLWGNNCLRGTVQPYICPGPACPPPPPKPKIASLAACAAKAAACADANFVSWSVRNKDCSWYKACTFTNASLRRFAGNGTDYRSQVVRLVKGAPPAGTSATGCCGDLYECTRHPPPSEGNCDKDPRGAWNIFS